MAVAVDGTRIASLPILSAAGKRLNVRQHRTQTSAPPASRPIFQEKMMKGQEGKKTAKKEPAKTMKEKKEAKKVKKEEKSRL